MIVGYWCLSTISTASPDHRHYGATATALLFRVISVERQERARRSLISSNDAIIVSVEYTSAPDQPQRRIPVSVGFIPAPASH